MIVEILNPFPYITPEERQLVRLNAGDIIDSTDESLLQGWINSGLAKLVDGDEPKEVKPVSVESDPKPIKERATKAKQPTAKK